MRHKQHYVSSTPLDTLTTSFISTPTESYHIWIKYWTARNCWHIYFTVQLYTLVIPTKVKCKDVLVHAGRLRWRAVAFTPKSELSVQMHAPVTSFTEPNEVRHQSKWMLSWHQSRSGHFRQQNNSFPCQESNYNPLIVQKAAMNPKNVPYNIHYVTNKLHMI